MEPSVFTKIINGEIPCHKIYEDDKVLAFLDIHPSQPGHTLVVPKKQVDLIWDLPNDTYQNLWSVAQKIAKHLTEQLNKRIGVVVDGTGVPHAHIHLIPFIKTTDLLNMPDMSAEPKHDNLAEMAERLKINE
jgi:histidine triad (HIT) family protein